MLKTVAGILFLCVFTLAIMFDGVGNHGHIMFRPNMKEDWVVWGIAIFSLALGLYLLKRGTSNSAKNKK